MENQKVFRSRVSVLLLGFILGIFIPCAIPLIKNMIISGLCIMGGTLVFIILLFSGMRYTISEDRLSLKIWKIPCGRARILDIISIKRSYNLLSSPAASLKRLSIHFTTGRMFWLISPVKEKEFIEELKAINPNIEIHIPEKAGIWRVWDWDI
ncbi:MAG: PH domain-containing protein [Prolixibacteraceae bacterium]|nr:PH domain-containing protein [Prolixibacteraceae bacterium]